MTRTATTQHPARRSVRDAAVAALGRSVEAVDPRSDGRYALELGSGETATLRLATDGDDAAHLVEPCLLSALAGANVPTPDLLAAVAPDASPFGVSFCITSASGQRLDHVLDLPESAHERLVREAGDHLAALHGTDIDARLSVDGGPYGDLRVPDCHPDAPLVVVDAAEDGVRPAYDRWPAYVERLTERALSGLRDGEFADLAPTVRGAISAAALPAQPAIAPLHLGYRAENLAFEPGITWPSHTGRRDGVVRAVRGFDSAGTGDGLLDLAIAEDALVGLPLGGTDRARELAAALREAYVAERGVSTPFGERYAAYLLLARARLLARTDATHRHTREHDADAAAARFRKRVETLAGELR